MHHLSGAGFRSEGVYLSPVLRLEACTSVSNDVSNLFRLLA